MAPCASSSSSPSRQRVIAPPLSCACSRRSAAGRIRSPASSMRRSGSSASISARRGRSTSCGAAPSRCSSHLVVVGWLSTALTVVGVEEQGLVERLGVPARGAPLDPGLHLHWPWPIDRVVRVPVRRVQTLHVGHEGEEEAGPEDVLWARQHGEAGVHAAARQRPRPDRHRRRGAVPHRGSARAGATAAQNPTDALRAIAYRAVMKSTVGRTLAQALSENVAALTARDARAWSQADARRARLGVEVVGFTVGGMHPPVARRRRLPGRGLGRAREDHGGDRRAGRTATQLVPRRRPSAHRRERRPRAKAPRRSARRAGEAWSFRALESEVQRRAARSSASGGGWRALEEHASRGDASRWSMRASSATGVSCG